MPKYKPLYVVNPDDKIYFFYKLPIWIFTDDLTEKELKNAKKEYYAREKLKNITLSK